jgi:hypothetical protein
MREEVHFPNAIPYAWVPWRDTVPRRAPGHAVVDVDMPHSLHALAYAVNA